MKAVLSDIHGNLEAFQAVLEDVRSRDISEIVCLGDVIGYGPEPRECLELACREADPLIMGNHEEAVLDGDASSFNAVARRAVEWTHEQVLGKDAPQDKVEAYREMLARFTTDANIEGIRYVHGSPLKPTKQYVTPRDAKNRRKMKAIFEVLEGVCFIGHTHVPGVFTEKGHSTPEEVLNVYMLGEEKALINVGSVGQPRDSDPRACYATFDVDTVVFHRVEYDVATAAAKIRAVPMLENVLAERLLVGR